MAQSAQTMTLKNYSFEMTHLSALAYQMLTIILAEQATQLPTTKAKPVHFCTLKWKTNWGNNETVNTAQ